MLMPIPIHNPEPTTLLLLTFGALVVYKRR